MWTHRILAVAAALGLAGSSARNSEVREVRLAVDTVTIAASEPIVRGAVRSAASASDFAVLTAGRDMWVVRSGVPPRSLRGSTSLPPGADWFSATCAAGDQVLVQVSSYPEEVRAREAAAPRGAFRRGPTAIGVAVVSSNTLRFIESFRVSATWPNIAGESTGEALPDRVTPLVQSCAWAGNKLVVGAYGYSAALDLNRATATLIENDAELTFNRHATLLIGDTLWTALDEGGMSGGCVERLVRGGRTDRFCVMGYSNSDLGIDALITTRWGLLTGSEAGVVEIIPGRAAYVHYQLSADRQQMEAFSIRCASGVLLALRDDGIALIDLPRRSARIARFASEALNTVYAVANVGREWYVATDSAVVRTQLPLPGRRPWRRGDC